MKKLIKKSFHRKESGFTLIELLIVIVIIGILAGVLIAVINPVRQQNRARNAAVRAAMLKTAFAVNTVRAGIGTLPSSSGLPEEMENITPRALDANCGSDTTLQCTFTMSGTTLPANCGADFYTPSDIGTNGCHLYLISVGNATFGNLISGQFRLVSAAFNLDSTATTYKLYVFDSSQGLLECGSGIDFQPTVADMPVDNTAAVSDSNCNVVSE